MELTNRPLPIAAIVHESAEYADEILYPFIQELQSQEKNILGVVQAHPEVSYAYGSQMGIIDLSSGAYLSIAQDLGKHNTSCCLDAEAVSNASTILQAARMQNPDLLIVNRFGKLEAEGTGFADEMLEIMSEGTAPMLTVVAERFLPMWREFTGGLATELEATPTALQHWFEQLPPKSTPES